MEGTLKMVKEAMEAGAKGVLIGRSVWGSENPAAGVKALRRIVHEGFAAEEAMKELK
jgi:class I fructose-bisphosphate aldolase